MMLNIRCVSLTFDEWTSIAGKNYLAITAHFVNSQKTIEKLLSFQNVSGKTKGDDLSLSIESIVKKFGLENKIISITTDNASNCALAIKKCYSIGFNGVPLVHVRCAAHTLNLIVKEGLKHVECELQSVRKAVHSVRASPKRLKEIEEICIVKGIKFKKIKNDVPTRWNSTLIMLQRYL